MNLFVTKDMVLFSSLNNLLHVVVELGPYLRPDIPELWILMSISVYKSSYALILTKGNFSLYLHCYTYIPQYFKMSTIFFKKLTDSNLSSSFFTI